MDKRDYTPTKSSKLLSNITNTQLYSNKPMTQYQRPTPTSQTPLNQRGAGSSEISIIKDYEALKMQVKQLQYQNRQLSNESQKLRYQKNIHQNKYHQKLSYQQDVISQFQKEKNYHLELIKIKFDEEVNKTKREYDYKLDDYHRQMRNRDYQNREVNQKNGYLELKTNQLTKGVETLEGQLIKYKESNNKLSGFLSNQQFKKQKLMAITDQLQRQKCQMEAQIHVLLDIEAEKSRTINTLQIQLRNSQATERSLNDKISVLTENFANLQEHIAIMKERLISTDLRNQQLQKQLHSAQIQLSDKDNSVMHQKEFEAKLRKDMQVLQQREVRRERQIEELIIQNQRLVNQANKNRQSLHDLCIVQGIEV